ncbi:type II toxin-antitoxin system RelE/ParE family toxin [Argonema antarcticum]|uniref:type II toxin-antitoxin system RelE/ParE family toxin n=1 Tax=Argonema antarcticum TaxID=2942763 RepID=UPI002013BC3E|nr:type II toxin-antitoxin system RelE/ParE family toxin [Argonema antarcticum]MCL1475940.1 type II toxin-antitoxin system RelE/ParE family toxin [Argonema antarcticum A004/B2]
MAFSVEISPSALADAEEAFLYIQKDSSLNAEEWYDGLVNAILSLENFPNRCPLASESEEIGREIHQLIYSRYRILFSVTGDVVQVLRIRHTARDWLSSDEL